MGVLSKLGACAVGGALWLAATGMAVAQQPKEIRIGLGALGFATAPARMAKEMGLYEKHGLNVRLIQMDTANDVVAGLLSKSLELASSGVGEIVTVQSRGQKVVELSSTYMGIPGTLVLDKAIAAKLGVSPTAPAKERLQALDGLLIATPSASSVYTPILKTAVSALGKNVRLTYIAPTAMVSALASGAIQGYFTGAPTWAPSISSGQGIVWLSGPKEEFPKDSSPVHSGSLQVMADYAEANRDTMKKVLDVFADFTKAIDERPAEVKAALAKSYPSLDAATVDLLFKDESRAWRLRPITPADMKQDIAVVKASGVELPNIDSIDPVTMLFKP